MTLFFRFLGIAVAFLLLTAGVWTAPVGPLRFHEEKKLDTQKAQERQKAEEACFVPVDCEDKAAMNRARESWRTEFDRAIGKEPIFVADGRKRVAEFTAKFAAAIARREKRGSGVATPEKELLALLQRRTTTEPVAAAQLVTELVRFASSGSFATREVASDALRAFGVAGVPALRSAWKNLPEVRARLQIFVDSFEKAGVPGHLPPALATGADLVRAGLRARVSELQKIPWKAMFAEADDLLASFPKEEQRIEGALQRHDHARNELKEVDNIFAEAQSQFGICESKEKSSYYEHVVHCLQQWGAPQAIGVEQLVKKWNPVLEKEAKEISAANRDLLEKIGARLGAKGFAGGGFPAVPWGLVATRHRERLAKGGLETKEAEGTNDVVIVPASMTFGSVRPAVAAANGCFSAVARYCALPRENQSPPGDSSLFADDGTVHVCVNTRGNLVATVQLADKSTVTEVIVRQVGKADSSHSTAKDDDRPCPLAVEASFS